MFVVGPRRQHPLLAGRGAHLGLGVPVAEDTDHAGVREERRELGGDVPVVDVDRHRPQLEAGQHHLEVLAAVVQIEADVVAGGDAHLVGEGRGERGRPRIERREGQPVRTAHDGLAVGDGVGHELEEVGEVECSCHYAADSAMTGDVASMLLGADGFVPKERYLSQAFFDLEMERLWPRVWQVACREEQVAEPGEFVEYTIGDQSVLVVRTEDGRIVAHHNACLHRGTRSRPAAGSSTRTTSAAGTTRGVTRSTGVWSRWSTRRVRLHPRGSEPESRAGRVLGRVRVREPRPRRGAARRVPPPASRPARGVPPRADAVPRLPEHDPAANWKVVVDAFNEAYHVQGTHPQMLPWTDDVTIAYEQLGNHAHYGRLPEARRELRPSPRLGLQPGEYDEGEILAGLVGGLGRLFLADELAIVEELRAAPRQPGTTLLQEYQSRRRDLLAARGLDVSGLSLDQMTSADDVFCFPNLVGPIYPGSAILFRVRPNGLDPDSSIKDTWMLEWPRRDAEGDAERRSGSRGSIPTGPRRTGARSRTRTTRTCSRCRPA